MDTSAPKMLNFLIRSFVVGMILVMLFNLYFTSASRALNEIETVLDTEVTFCEVLFNIIDGVL
jgi:hypothetical protein